jgi:hypothetical protein
MHIKYASTSCFGTRVLCSGRTQYTCPVFRGNTLTVLKHQCTVLLKKRTAWPPLAQKCKRLVNKLIRGKQCTCPLCTSRDPKPRTKSQHRDSLGNVAEFRYLGTTHEEIKSRWNWGRATWCSMLCLPFRCGTAELTCACCQQLWNLAPRITVPQHSLS